jgi:hypothetical protein
VGAADLPGLPPRRQAGLGRGELARQISKSESLLQAIELGEEWRAFVAGVKAGEFGLG